MGNIAQNPVARLVCGMLAADEAMLDKAEQSLAEMGRIVHRSETWTFTETDYYAAEMGASLLRRFVAVDGLFDPAKLPEMKRRTNEIELSLRGGATGRTVNLDPGYISLSKLVLASTKNHAHRIYLGDGIFGELTLRYLHERWHAWPWTYPDYSSGKYDGFLDEVREALRDELAEERRDGREHRSA